jgi:enoyl-CoA hydratase/carnithine racemase
MTEVLRCELNDGVYVLTLNRPNDMNALSSALVAALRTAVDDAAVNPDVKVVIITGQGRAFCSGADLIEAAEVATSIEAFRSMVLPWRDAFNAIERCPKPVIAAVNGIALAGGLELALACDLIVASDAARLGDGHIRYGLVPGGGASQRLPHAIGSRRARWLMYSGDVLDARQAETIGLVQTVFPAASFTDDVHDMALRMARRSGTALAFMKRMSAPRLSDDGLDLEIESAARVITGADAREGLAAFAEKREPIFGSATPLSTSAART